MASRTSADRPRVGGIEVDWSNLDMGGLRRALARGIWSIVFMVTPGAGNRGGARCSEGHSPDRVGERARFGLGLDTGAAQVFNRKDRKGSREGRQERLIRGLR